MTCVVCQLKSISGTTPPLPCPRQRKLTRMRRSTTATARHWKTATSSTHTNTAIAETVKTVANKAIKQLKVERHKVTHRQIIDLPKHGNKKKKTEPTIIPPSGVPPPPVVRRNTPVSGVPPVPPPCQSPPNSADRLPRLRSIITFLS